MKDGAPASASTRMAESMRFGLRIRAGKALDTLFGTMGSTLSLGFVLLAFLTGDAHGWSIYNDSSVPVRAQVLEGDFDEILVPFAGSASCHWSNTSCNPAGTQTATVTLQIETLDGDPRKLSLMVSMEAGGYARVTEEARPALWASPTQMLLQGYRTNGQLFEQEPLYVIGKKTRDVRFLISADCQFCNLNDCTEEENPIWTSTALQVNSLMKIEAGNDGTIRGVCYAGDLTQFASDSEFNLYTASISFLEGTALTPSTRKIYDGLGNHDLDKGRTSVRDAVRDRLRTTVRTQDGGSNPHYSWDWHDVHFAQLNLSPANFSAAPNAPVNEPGGQV